MKHLQITWDEYHRLIERLAMTIRDSGYQPDQILCLARGGMRVGDVLSRLFRVPLAVLSTSSYRGESTEPDPVKIATNFTAPFHRLEGKLLLVDDLVDSGVTFREIAGWLKTREKSLTDMRTAVLWMKACSVVTPDYYVDFLPDNPWIMQPFEVYDGMDLTSLK